jgi:hypothetical protein
MRKVIAVLVCIAALVLGTGMAGATVIQQEHYSGTDAFSFDDCGFTLDVQSEFHGQALLRVEEGGQAFLVKDKYWYRDVLTNPETGRWFVQRGNAVFNEITSTQVDGTIYEFEAIEAGQPFVIEDSAGNVVVRDRGVISFRYVFDTLGDGVPGGELVEDLGSSVHGPHPGFAEDFPFCEIAAELTGA